jgi:DNA-binding NarL/FixJ family response regulator
MKPHILIIDADAGAAYITRAVAQRVAPQATCRVVSNAASSLHDVGERPDVVIVDPPHLSLAGIRLIRELQEAYPETHVIVLASVPTPTLRRDMQQLGVESYLEKPAPYAELAAALRASLRSLSPPQTAPVSIAQ